MGYANLTLRNRAQCQGLIVLSEFLFLPNLQSQHSA
jgi:hypothetical protein